MSKKVYLGLSGGVDSAVSAALLKQSGYDVVGVYVKVWQPDWLVCNWKEERLDAMRVAAHLGIPFFTLDAEREYKEGVIDYLIREYSAGRTPNPDVMCNREVKFGVFWKWAQKQGADYIATGHYARVIDLNTIKNNKLSGFNETQLNSRFKLLAGVDLNKDQSYFLWTLSQSDLAHVIFPVGELTKPEVRRLAKKFGLPNADKKDSQGLCFIGKIDFQEFLSHYLKSKSGKVINEQGKIIGKHPGAVFFTLGERHGFIISVKTPSDRPYYVIAKNLENNTITISTDKLIRSDPNSIVRISQVNWVAGKPTDLNRPIMVRTRYRQQLIKAKIIDSDENYSSHHTHKDISNNHKSSSPKSINNNLNRGLKLKLDKINDPITPGQSLVIYDGPECLGGGIIE